MDEKNILITTITPAGKSFYDFSKVKDKPVKEYIPFLRAEPTNKYDKNAVEIWVGRRDNDQETYKIGYIPREFSRIVACLMNYGVTLVAEFVNIDFAIRIGLK